MVYRTSLETKQLIIFKGKNNFLNYFITCLYHDLNIKQIKCFTKTAG